MKITRRQLRQLIKEELSRPMREAAPSQAAAGTATAEAGAKKKIALAHLIAPTYPIDPDDPTESTPSWPIYLDYAKDGDIIVKVRGQAEVEKWRAFQGHAPVWPVEDIDVLLEREAGTWVSKKEIRGNPPGTTYPNSNHLAPIFAEDRRSDDDVFYFVEKPAKE